MWRLLDMASRARLGCDHSTRLAPKHPNPSRMTQPESSQSATLRQSPSGALAFFIALWIVLSGLAAMAGPFGTFDLLEFAPRLAYWAAVVAVSIALDYGLRWLLRGRPRHWRLLGRIPYAIVLACIIHAMNRIVFAHWGGWQDLLWLAFIVMSVGAAIEGTLIILSPDPASAPTAPGSDPAESFLRRLPIDKRGAVVRLEAQDHYLNVVTTAGEALVLLRMADAEAELEAAHGMRVHRSHWVAIDRVVGHRRRDGRDFLVTADQAEVPVSRSFRPAVKAAGLIV